MKMTEQKAYEMRLQQNIKKFRLTYEDLLTIAKNNMLEVHTYNECFPELASRGYLNEVLHFNAFTIFNGEKQEIYIRDELSDGEKRVAIAHEFGHIVMKHTYIGILGKADNPLRQNEQEKEADEFALYFLGVPCVLKKYHQCSIHQVRQATALPVDAARKISLYTAQIETPNMLQKKMCRRCDFENGHRFTRLLKWIGGLIVCLIFLISAGRTARPYSVKQTPEDPQTPAIGVSDPDIPADLSDLVYITESGDKYHREDCRYIRGKEAAAVPREEARRQWKEPCKICNP